MQYGKENEYNAFNKYNLQYIHRMGFTVEKTGLWINIKYPGLSVSPGEGGLMFDPITESYDVIEIKCLFI